MTPLDSPRRISVILLGHFALCLDSIVPLLPLNRRQPMNRFPRTSQEERGETGRMLRRGRL